MHLRRGAQQVQAPGAAREVEQFGVLPAQRARGVRAQRGARLGREAVPVPEAGVGERELHARFPRAEPRRVAQRALELAVGLGQPRFQQRDVGPGVGRAGAAADRLALVVERLAQVPLRERIARLERQRAVFIQAREVLEVVRLAGIEFARLAQQGARAGPFLRRGLPAFGFPGPDDGVRFEAAQVAQAARQRERREAGEGGEDGAAPNDSQLGLAVLPAPVPPPPAPELPVGVLEEAAAGEVLPVALAV